MSVLIVPAHRTPQGFHTLPATIQAGFAAIHEPIGSTEARNLAVIVALETSRGAAMVSYNLGNITATASYSGKAWRPPWYDEPGPNTSARNRELHARMLAGQAPSAFRAYDTLSDGAADFARVLVRDFPEVMLAARHADARELRDALAERYSHDYGTEAALRNIASLQRELGVSGEPTLAPVANGLALVALAYLLWRRFA